MKIKLALAGIGILLLILAAVGWYLYNKPHAGVANIEADVSVTAAQLYKDFQQDETLANKKYLNKVIEVSGNIADVQHINDVQIILLNSGETLGGVSCRLNNSDNNKNYTVKKSGKLTVKGRCSGYLMDVNLVDCIIK